LEWPFLYPQYILPLRMKYEFAKKCRKHAPIILSGRILAIDPASGGTSLPGYAFYEAGELKDSGVIKLDQKAPFQNRLHELSQSYFELCGGVTPDVLVVEKIRGPRAHIYLKWAVGITIAAVNANVNLECPHATWFRYKPDDYVKSDKMDAECIGRAAVITAAL
jgi:hypothetical protein